MKTILLPTDFSDEARNAALYAVEFFGSLSNYVLLHVSDVQVNRLALKNISEEIRVSTEKLLKEQVNDLIDEVGNIEIHSTVEIGEEATVIADQAKLINADCIVMGAKGKSAAENLLVGSTTYDTIRRVKIPVIAVPKSAEHHELNKVVFAADYKAINHNISLEPMLELCQENEMELLILNVVDSSELVSMKEAIEAVKLDNYFSEVGHSFHYIEDSDIANGINRFTEDQEAEMLVVLAREESFFHRLSEASVTRAVTLNAHLPILVLQDYE